LTQVGASRERSAASISVVDGPPRTRGNVPTTTVGDRTRGLQGSACPAARAREMELVSAVAVRVQETDRGPPPPPLGDRRPDGRGGRVESDGWALGTAIAPALRSAAPWGSGAGCAAQAGRARGDMRGPARPRRLESLLGRRSRCNRFREAPPASRVRAWWRRSSVREPEDRDRSEPRIAPSADRCSDHPLGYGHASVSGELEVTSLP